MFESCSDKSKRKVINNLLLVVNVSQSFGSGKLLVVVSTGGIKRYLMHKQNKCHRCL